MPAARDWRARTGGMKLDGAAVPFRYQRAGRAQKWRTGAHDPAAVADLRAWLESRLGGPLAGLVIETAAKEARMPRCADYAPDIAALYRCAAGFPARPMPAAPALPEIVRFDPEADPARPSTVFGRLLAQAPASHRPAA